MALIVATPQSYLDSIVSLNKAWLDVPLDSKHVSEFIFVFKFSLLRSKYRAKRARVEA